MKHVFLALLLCSTFSHAQIIFEKGYFISNDGSRTNCLIENIDWKNNPTSFNYKLQEGEKIQKNGLADVQEFGIDNVSQYKRFTVNIERSGNEHDARQLSKSKSPVFKKETLFLQTV